MPTKKSYITATDQFCGAGGSTTGAKEAGIEVVMALNHWELAIETHNTNHPDTKHDCTDIQACDPRRYPSTDILFTSPECTHQSNANGKPKPKSNQLNAFEKFELNPAHERSRATMWDVPRFAEYHNYNIIVVENVVEARKWRLWDAWLHSMQLLGYNHKCCSFNSMFFGTCPQSRDRLYVVFWKKGNKAPDLNFKPKANCKKCGEVESYQWWKNTKKKVGKHGIIGGRGQYIYRCSKCTDEVMPYFHAALNCIDFNVPITRIGDRKKPLSPKTMQRIQHGLDKYINKELIITTRYSSGIDCRVKDASNKAFPTQPADKSHFYMQPPLIHTDGYGGTVNLPYGSLNTQTTIQDKSLMMFPFIAELYGNSKTKEISKALGTVTAGGIKQALVLANYSPGYAKSLSEALPTVTGSDENGILTTKSLQAFIQYYYSNGNQTSTMGEAIRTVTTTDRAGLVVPNIDIMDCYYRTIKSHEIQKAMAFPDKYIVLGNSKEKVKQLGNAVTPPVQKWIAQRCLESLL